MEHPERQLLAVIPMLAWMKDCSGRYIYVNPAFCSFVGRSAIEILGTSGKGFWGAPFATRIASDENRVISLRTPLFKQDLVPMKGRSVWLEYRLTPILDEEERVVAIAGIGEDITFRKDVEGQLVSALDTALEARHMASLGIMAAGITHELNQPLQAIKLSADSIVYWYEKKKNFDPKAVMKALGLISRNSDRIQRIIQRVRNFVKSRQAVQKISPVDLNQAVGNGLEMIEHQLQSHGIELVLELDPAISRISGDETQLEEVVINLVTNSRQSLDLMSEGEKRIRIQTSEREDGVCLLVSDTGTGFSEDARENIFRPFYTTKAEGLGLGLSIVHSIVSGFSGKIELLPSSEDYSTNLSVLMVKWKEED